MAEERVQRRLAAILAADVVGFSRLMEQDEAGTLARLKTLRSELFEPKTKEHGGRIFKTTGDGALVEFKSAVDAVKSALDIQEALAVRDVEGSEDQKILLRIGISLGDVIVEGGDLYGNGVNVAARLEGLSDPGGICISGNVHEHIGNTLDVALEDMGEQFVKNIDRPIRCYRINLSAGDAAHSRLPIPEKPSIAVLPFDNMSGDSEQEYFADGITEDIITGLSRIRELFVIARNTTFTYKGRAVDVQAVARDLGVQYVLEGSVRKAGSRVRISTQLIDGQNGNHIWAERYDRDLEDVFALQDEITLTVVGTIEPELSRAEQNRALQKPPENLRAWDHVQRGWWNLLQFESNAFKEALSHFQEAVDLEPRFARAHVGVSWVKFMMVMSNYSKAPSEDLALSNAAAKRATELDDQDAFAHAVLGLTYLRDRKHALAIEEFRRAISLNPSYARAQHWLGFAYAFNQQNDEAIRLQDVATRLSPNDPLLWGMMNVRAIGYFNKGEFEQAAEWSVRSTLQPNCAVPARLVLVACLARLDRKSELAEAIRKLNELAPGYTVHDFNEAYPFQREADSLPWLESLRKAGLPEN